MPEAHLRTLWCKIIKQHFQWLIRFSSSLWKTDTYTQSCPKSIKSYWFCEKDRETSAERKTERYKNDSNWDRDTVEDVRGESKRKSNSNKFVVFLLDNWKIWCEWGHLTFPITILQHTDNIGRLLRNADHLASGIRRLCCDPLSLESTMSWLLWQWVMWRDKSGVVRVAFKAKTFSKRNSKRLDWQVSSWITWKAKLNRPLSKILVSKLNKLHKVVQWEQYVFTLSLCNRNK